ncbi:VOC family protein [Halalkalibacillus sediminis]
MEKIRIRTFLMFQGQAEEAMKLYTTLFPNSEILEMSKYEEGQGGRVGDVLQATFTLNGVEYMCIDSPTDHDFTFTPSMSLYVDFDSEEELDRVYERLSEGGKLLMPLDKQPFSKKFGWVEDRFGVSWQLNLK